MGSIPKDSGCLGRLNGDLHQIILGRINIDGTVTEQISLIAANEHETGTDDLVAGLGLDQLKCRTYGVCSRISSSSKKAVTLAHLNKHGAKIVALGQSLADLLLCHLAFSKLHHLRNHGIHLRIGQGIYDLALVNIIITRCRGSLNLVHITQKNNAKDTFCRQSGGGIKNTAVRSLCINDGSRILLEILDHLCQHIITSSQSSVSFP